MSTRTNRQRVSPRERLMYGDRIWPPQQGYDLAATMYDSWHWQEFWLRNELPFVANLAGTFGDGRGILDLGCGTGTYLAALNEAGSIGVDPSLAMLSRARRKVSSSIAVVAGRASDIPIRSNSFKLCLSARSMSHEPDLTVALAEISRVLNPGGVWIATDVHPQHNYPQTRIPVAHETDVHIQTFKRSHTDLISAATSTGVWSTEFVREFRWNDLSWAPTNPLFDRVDRSGSRPIFFMVVLRRH